MIVIDNYFLFGFILGSLFFSSAFLQISSHKIGKLGSASLSVGILSLNLFLSFYFFFNYKEFIVLKFKPWVYFNIILIDFGFILDMLSIIMLIVILSISLFVHFFSIDYMNNDPQFVKFFSYINLFTGFMLILVSADNLVVLFVGWEGVGICSYLLINFWYTRIQANKAALKAMIMNKIGDCGLIVAILIVYKYFGTSNFVILKVLMPYFYTTKIFNINLISILAFFLFLAAIGKSAQLGLHTWLPDAMEGPTPVSALIHAATMVTAGVYLIIRCNFIFELTPVILWLCLFIGSITIVFGSIIAFFQNDIKKIIAYSTCSQLGYMFLACGFQNYIGGLFHLFTHAFFKALLFLTAGFLIHLIFDEQDTRSFGNFLLKKLPLIYTCLFVGSIVLCGLLFCSGMYSKDFILEVGFNKAFILKSSFFYFIATFSIFFSMLYSLKLIYISFFINSSSYKAYLLNISHRTSFISILILITLSIFSIVLGYYFENIFKIFNFKLFDNIVYANNINIVYIEIEFVNFFIKLVPTIFFFLVMFIYFCVKSFGYSHIKFNFYFLFFVNKLGIDIVYNFFFKIIFNISLEIFLIFEKGLLNFGYLNSIFNFFIKTGLVQLLKNFSFLNTNFNMYLYFIYFYTLFYFLI